MDLAEKIAICEENFKRWREAALKAKDMNEARRFMEKAFFWLKLQTAFITLFSLESFAKGDEDLARKILIAKVNLIKKMVDYTKNLIDEMLS